MNTGISKAIALLALLAGCGEGLGGAEGSPPLREADMAQGAVRLSAPDGYCIDRRSLKRSFAVLARCDTLGMAPAGSAAPLGLITVSLSPVGPDAAQISATHFQASLGAAKVLDARDLEGGVLMRVQGATAPRPGLSAVHWRGAARIGGQALGVAIYGAEASAVTQAEGGAILEDLMRRTVARSAAVAPAKPEPNDTPAEKGLGAAIAGLFD